MKQHHSLLKDTGGYIGNLPSESIHMGALQPYIAARRMDGEHEPLTMVYK